MSRRTWIKIYPEGFLRKTLYEELNPVERWVFVGFLCLAGDSGYDGNICITKDLGYTDEQLAAILDVNLKDLLSAKEKMIKNNKITVSDKNVISIVSWNIYQSEYERQKKYRNVTDITNSYNNKCNFKLQPKVTTKSYNQKLHIEEDIEEEIEYNNINNNTNNNNITNNINNNINNNNLNKYNNTLNNNNNKINNINNIVNTSKVKFSDFVYLTKQEYDKLIAKFGEDKTKDMIEKLNFYIGSKGKKYKSHYYTILNWERMERDRIKEKSLSVSNGNSIKYKKL